MSMKNDLSDTGNEYNNSAKHFSTVKLYLLQMATAMILEYSLHRTARWPQLYQCLFYPTRKLHNVPCIKHIAITEQLKIDNYR